MLSYLRESRKFLSISERICIVLGNESCDADSAVSAIALAYFYSKKPKVASEPAAFIPMLNIPRQSFPIKTEVSYLLKKYEITEDCLLFKDDTSDEFIRNNSLILVDHHVSPYRDSVIEVYDHRPFDSSSNLPKSCKTTIEQVGSCSTLIGNLILRSQESNDEFKLIFQLLYGAIVLDTVNFSPDAHRSTELDLKVVTEIENILGIKNPIEHRETLFAELVKAREDISVLSPHQLLYKDMKLISNPSGTSKVGLPGYPILVQEFIKKAGAEEAVKKFAEELKCNVVLLMGMKVVGQGVSRDMGLINIKDSELFSQVLNEIQAHKDPDLGLKEHEGVDFLGGRFFHQENLRATRKHVLPIVQKILDKMQ